jgi:hypothetical protein
VRFKLDENLPVSSAAIVASAGHDVDTVTEEGLIGAPDRDVVAAATAAGRVLISLDRGLGDIRAYDEQHQDGHGTHPVPGGLPSRTAGHDPYRHLQDLVTARRERPAVGVPERRHHQLQRYPRHGLRPVAGGKALGGAGDHRADDLSASSNGCRNFSVLVKGTS